MDYREFANVVKYRIAMMRKSIQAKISAVSEVESSRVVYHHMLGLNPTLHMTRLDTSSPSSPLRAARRARTAPS
jgi:hypothetical protein